MKESHLRNSVVASIPLVAIILMGCEENLVPREHYDDVPFSMYGVLSPDLDTQSVRIYPLEDFLTLGSPEPLEIDVTSTNLQTADRRTWRDTILVDQNGQHEYVFWALFRPEFGHEYRVEVVRRSDGATSYADVRIPPPVTVRWDEQDAPLLHVFVEGEDFRALSPEVEYTTRDTLKTDTSTIRNSQYTIPYEGKEERVDGGWRVTINMIVDYLAIHTKLIAPDSHPFSRSTLQRAIPYLSGADYSKNSKSQYCFNVVLYGMELHLLVGDTAWNPAGGIFDRDRLSFPTTLSNVENGFGFVGSGYRIGPSLFPSKETVESACFIYSL